MCCWEPNRDKISPSRFVSFWTRCAVETGDAASVSNRKTAAFRRESDQALSHVHTFLDDLIQIRRAERATIPDWSRTVWSAVRLVC